MLSQGIRKGKGYCVKTLTFEGLHVTAASFTLIQLRAVRNALNEKNRVLLGEGVKGKCKLENSEYNQSGFIIPSNYYNLIMVN